MGEMVLLKDLADKVTDSKDDIILAKVNGKLQELTKTVDSDSLIEFVTTAEPAGGLLLHLERKTETNSTFNRSYRKQDERNCQSRYSY